MSLKLHWGVPGDSGIAQALGLSEKMTYKLLERGHIAGARKVGGQWCFDPSVFAAAMREPATISRTDGKSPALAMAM